MITKGAYVTTKDSTKGNYTITVPGTEWLVLDISTYEAILLNKTLYPEGTLCVPLEDLELISTSKSCRSNMTLPIDSNERKNYPLYRGCLRYFPAALAGVAKTSKLGNDKHNPNEEMHHARSKSADQGDCIIRHLIDTEDLRASLERGDSNVTPQDILNEVNQLAWRALAFSQELHEKFGSPMAPGAKK